MREQGLTKDTEQYILNQSFDPDFHVLATELLAYDPVSTAMKRVTMDSLNNYATCDVDNTTPTCIYEGLQDAEEGWQIVKTTTSGTILSIRFATIKNNSTYSSYADAWTNRAILNFDYYGVAF
jgi:hypothetical protein